MNPPPPPGSSVTRRRERCEQSGSDHPTRERVALQKGRTAAPSDHSSCPPSLRSGATHEKRCAKHHENARDTRNKTCKTHAKQSMILVFLYASFNGGSLAPPVGCTRAQRLRRWRRPWGRVQTQAPAWAALRGMHRLIDSLVGLREKGALGATDNDTDNDQVLRVN